MRVLVNATPRPGRFTPVNDPVSFVLEAGRAPGPVWTGAENPRTVPSVASSYTDWAIPVQYS